MIKNIIFDMGQVLIKFDPIYFLKRVGITSEKEMALLQREIFKSLEWAMMDRGSLNDEEACNKMCERLPESYWEVAKKLVCGWPYPLVPVEGADKIVNELYNSGYKIYLLSNASHMQKEYWPDISCSKLFAGRVVSAEVGLVKPQPEIYQLLLDKYNLKAEESVFIDDSPANCEGATQCNIHSIVFHGDYDEIYEKLELLGVALKEKR